MFFDHYRKRWRSCRVRLCGIHKKNIWGAVNLHKLPGKSSKTVTNQECPARKGYLSGKEPLFPMPEEGADDMSAVAFVNGRVVKHKSFPSFPVFMGGNDINLFPGGYL